METINNTAGAMAAIHTNDALRSLLQTQEPLDSELAPYVVDSLIGPYLKHPLVYGSADPHLYALLNHSLAAKTDRIEKASKEGNWALYIALFEKPYRIWALTTIQARLEDQPFWELFANTWGIVENLWQCKKDIRSLLNSHNHRYEYIMTNEERAILEAYPGDLLTIYRGHQKRNRVGYSWTFSPSEAEWFAHRFASDSSEGIVTQAKVKRRNVIAFFNGRGENEVVVRPRDIQQATRLELVREQ